MVLICSLVYISCRFVTSIRVCSMDHERFASQAGGRKAHRIESCYFVQGKTINYTGSTVEDSCHIIE